MKERGFPFHQQTIQRIEEGSRSVRLDEAFAMAEILEKRVEEMTWDREAIRRNAARRAIWAGLPTNIVDRVMKEFLTEIEILEAIVETGFDDALGMEAPTGIYCGLELIKRGLERTDAITDQFYKEAESYAQALRELGELPVDEAEEEAAIEEDFQSPAEKRVRDLLEKHGSSIPKSVSRMSLADLARTFAGESDG